MIVNRRAAIQALGRASVAAAFPSCLTTEMCPPHPAVADFTPLCFTDARGVGHRVYAAGEGPPVLLLHELPGLSDETFVTARKLRDARYTVLVPLLFGKPGDSAAFRNMYRICGDDQFDCNGAERTSAHVTWLRELARCASETSRDSKGVGVIGMCLTGAFPIAMLREPAVVAPILCQPTLPFNRFNPLQAFGWFLDERALAVHPDDLGFAKTHTTMPLLGVRYRGDRRCKKGRFARLAQEFPDRFHRLDLDGDHHSSLVGDFSPVALAEVLSFLNQQLRITPDPAIPPFPNHSKRSTLEVIPPPPFGL